MKLQKKEILVETNASTKVRQFTINSNDATIFEILRKNMYSDPVGAVVREIATNARDANAEVGKADEPIHITLPSRNYPYLVIKDFGPGISPERMEKFYSSYGSSTKRDTNDQIGAWGLGSKTPFCLTDQYIITSNIDGLKYEYTCYIDETGRGAIAEEDPVPTTEPNGTSVRIPISEDKFSECKQKALFYTEFWPVQPVFPGQFDTRKPPKILMQGEGWKLFEIGPYANRPRVILAGIPYTIRDEHWHTKKGNGYYGYNIDSYIPRGFCFDLKTGDVAISSNRETIYEDDATKAKLQSIWENFKIEYVKEYNQQIKTKNLFEAIDFVRDLLSNHQGYFSSIVGDNVTIKNCSVNELKNYIEVELSWEKYYYADSHHYNMFSTKNDIILIDAKDLTPGIKSKCSRFLRDNKITHATILFSDTAVGKAVAEYWKNEPKAKIHDFGQIKTGKSKNIKSFVYYYDSRYSRAQKLVLEDIKSTDKFVYVEWDNLRPSISDSEFVKLGYKLMIMKPIYIQKIKGNSQFINLDSFMQIWHDKVLSKKDSYELLTSSASIKTLDSNTKDKLNIFAPNTFKKIEQSAALVKKENSKLDLLNYLAQKYNSDYYNALNNSTSLVAQLQKLVQDETRKYPLVMNMRTYDDIVQYKLYVSAMKKCNRSIVLSDFIKTI